MNPLQPIQPFVNFTFHERKRQLIIDTVSKIHQSRCHSCSFRVNYNNLLSVDMYYKGSWMLHFVL
jgi:hypothetical protein